MTAAEKEIYDKFSQRWELFRIATHEMGGLHLLSEMEWKYSTRQLYDMLEVIDVHDSLKEIALKKEEQESKKNSAARPRHVGMS